MPGDVQNRRRSFGAKSCRNQACSFDEKDRSFPPSSSTSKTLHYVQKNVHDFGWFADKRFHVLKDVATLESGKKVDCWAMFTNQEASLWQRGAEYVKRSVEFYSANVGDIRITKLLLAKALSAGAGMEYPNVTVIGVRAVPKP